MSISDYGITIVGGDNNRALSLNNNIPEKRENEVNPSPLLTNKDDENDKLILDEKKNEDVIKLPNKSKKQIDISGKDIIYYFKYHYGLTKKKKDNFEIIESNILKICDGDDMKLRFIKEYFDNTNNSVKLLKELLESYKTSISNNTKEKFKHKKYAQYYYAIFIIINRTYEHIKKLVDKNNEITDIYNSNISTIICTLLSMHI